MPAAELPFTLVTSVTRTLQTAVAVTSSPFTGTQQVQDWGGEWWAYEIEFTVRQGADGRRLSAFFAALGGLRDTFIFRDPFVGYPRATGVALVNGAGQTGNTLAIDGLGTQALLAGDFIQLGALGTTRLYQVTADATPVAGAATLQIVPRLRAASVNNEAVNIKTPGVLLRLTSPVPASIGLADIYRISISAREAL
jgi:hypothetical protein